MMKVGAVDLPSRGKAEKAVKLFQEIPRWGKGGFPWIRTSTKKQKAKKENRLWYVHSTLYGVIVCVREKRVEAEVP